MEEDQNMEDDGDRRVSLGDVAKAAGLSKAAVSMALSGRKGVSDQTRQRVKEIAQELGYVVNPAAKLLAQRRTGRCAGAGLSIGVLADHEHERREMRDVCRQMDLQPSCWSPQDFSSPEAASRVLWNRGVSGLLLPYNLERWDQAERSRFQWARFSVVKKSRGMRDLPFHLVRHSAFDYMDMTLTEVVRRGYRRIAVMLAATNSSQDDDARVGALLNFKLRKLPPGTSLEWRLAPWMPTADFAWLKDARPDVIVLYHWSMIYRLLEEGWRIPGDTAVAAVLATSQKIPNTPAVSGCDADSPHLTTRALQVLLDLIGRGERGFPKRSMEHVVEPTWLEGDTLPLRG